MIRMMTALGAVSLLGGCATFEDFEAARHPSINSVRGGDVTDKGEEVKADFNKLLEAIGKDRQLLQDKGKVWDRGETAFGLAVLASAAYGGFNTTFGGSNLEDAAFAAASIASLRGFAAPGGRRDAYYKASAAMNCLYSAASVFADDPPARFTVAKSGAGAITGISFSDPPSIVVAADPAQDALRSQRGDMNAVLSSVASAMNTDLEEFEPGKKYNGLTASRIQDLNMARERQRDQMKTAVVGLAGVNLTEQTVFADRFNIVGSAYLTIMTRLFNETRSIVDAQTVADELAAALAKETESKQAATTSMAAFGAAAGFNASSAAAMTDDQTKFVEAAANIAKCAAGS